MAVDVVGGPSLEHGLEVAGLIGEQVAERHANAAQRAPSAGDEGGAERDEKEELREIEHLLAETVMREHHSDAVPGNQDGGERDEEPVTELEEYRLVCH